MRKEELPQFAETWLTYCQINKPDYTVSPVQMGIISKQFIGYELKEIVSALDVVIGKTPFQITPADVLAVLNESSDRNLAIAADEAYELAYSTSCTYCNRSVVFDDPVITQTINEVFLGWQNFCSLKPEYKEADRKRFVTGYLGIISSGHVGSRSVMTGEYSGSVKLVRADKTISLTEDQLNRYLAIGEVPKLELVPNETAYVDSLPVVDDPVMLAKLRDSRSLEEALGMILKGNAFGG